MMKLKPAIAALASFAVATPSLAADGTTIDLTGLAVAVTGGVFSILGIIVTAIINSRMKDRAAADALSQAVKNSLGAIQQAATSEIQAAHPRIPGVPASLAPGVQYVLDHAGDEAHRLGVTTTAIAQKVEAQVGLANIANAAAPQVVVAAPGAVQ